MTNKRCATCEHWNARLDKRGRRILAGRPAYACKAPLPEMFDLPACIRQVTYGFGFRWPPERSFMEADQGQDCTFWRDWKAHPEAKNG